MPIALLRIARRCKSVQCFSLRRHPSPLSCHSIRGKGAWLRNWASQNAGNVDDQLKMLRYVGARAVSDAIRFVLSGGVELGVVALLPGPSFWRRYNRVGTRRSLKLSGSSAPDWATTVRSVSGVMEHLTAGTRVRPVSQGEGGEEEERLDRAKPTDTNQPFPVKLDISSQKSHLEVVSGCHHPLEAAPACHPIKLGAL